MNLNEYQENEEKTNKKRAEQNIKNISINK